MTLLRKAIALAAFALAGPTFAASYVASLQAPAAMSNLISSHPMWRCGGLVCVAEGEASSPAKHICSRLAKAVGPLSGFTVKGKAFAVDELAACNTAAAR